MHACTNLPKPTRPWCADVHGHPSLVCGRVCPVVHEDTFEVVLDTSYLHVHEVVLAHHDGHESKLEVRRAVGGSQRARSASRRC